jgi:hypothetical protein
MNSISIYEAFQQVHSDAEDTLRRSGLTFDDLRAGEPYGGLEDVKELMAAATFDAYVWSKIAKRVEWAFSDQSIVGLEYSRIFNVPDFKPISFAQVATVDGDDVELGSVLRVAFGRPFTTDLNEISQLRDRPAALGRAAARTLGKQIAGALCNGTVTYDGLPLFCKTHHNLLDGDTDLGAQSLLHAAAVLAEQTDPNGNPISLRPAVLLTSPDLELLAPRALEDARAQARKDGSRIFDDVQHVVDEHLTGRDWYLLADSQVAPVVGVGFLNGQRNPDVFYADPDQRYALADAPESSNDRQPIRWNLRHYWGVTVFDWRGAVKAPARPRVSAWRRVLRRLLRAIG